MTGGTGTGWEDYLDTGETLLWHGAPKPGFRVKPLSVFLSLLGLGFLPMGLLAIQSGLRQMTAGTGEHALGFGLAFALFGVPFVAIGAGLLFGPWYVAWKTPDKVQYALSDRRAYIASSWWKQKLEVYPIIATDVIELEQGRTDTVWFKTTHGRDSEGGPTIDRAGFRDIVDGQRVYDLLRQIQNADR